LWYDFDHNNFLIGDYSLTYLVSYKKAIFCIISFCVIFLSNSPVNAQADKWNTADGSPDINYVKKKALEIQAVAEMTQDIIERTNDAPITKTWLEPGSVILNVMVVNPSTTKTQKAILKAYLPKEAKPEDIIDASDLQVTYDIEKGLYYAFKEFELAPGEMVKRSVHIKDIWIIRESELESMLTRADDILKELKGTPYIDTAVTLKKDMDDKNVDILAKQKEAANALPEPHIAAYRRNLDIIEVMKADLVELESMLSRAKPASGVAVKRIFVKASWWIILAVIVSLLLLSFIFFFIWHKQAAVTIEGEQTPKDKEAPPSSTNPEEKNKE